MLQFWVKPITPTGSFALAIVYLKQSGYPLYAGAKLSDLGMYEPAGYKFTEIFDGYDMGMLKPRDNFTARVDPPGIVLVKAVPVDKRNNKDGMDKRNIIRV